MAGSTVAIIITRGTRRSAITKSLAGCTWPPGAIATGGPGAARRIIASGSSAVSSGIITTLTTSSRCATAFAVARRRGPGAPPDRGAPDRAPPAPEGRPAPGFRGRRSPEAGLLSFSVMTSFSLTQNGHPSGWPFHKEVRRCPTLPQGPPCSTIGAEGLSFRVRNVTGRFPFAMAAETLLIYQSEGNQSYLVADRFSTVNREPQSGREHHSCGVKLSAY